MLIVTADRERESERERDRDSVQTKYFGSEFEHLLGFFRQSRCLFQKDFFYSIYLFNFLLLQRPNPRQDQSPNLRKKLRYVIGCILLSIMHKRYCDTQKTVNT